MRLPFLIQHPAHFIALGAGAGLSPIAPGTMGTIFAGLLYYFAAQQWGEIILGMIFLGLLAVGYGAVNYLQQNAPLNQVEHDWSAIVIDEIAAFWGVLWILDPSSIATIIYAFFWFRVFDIVKPWGIRQFERRHLNAYGVMGDDVMAGFYVLFLFALWRWL